MMVKKTGGDRNEQLLLKPAETRLERLKKQHHEEKKEVLSER